MGSLCCPKVPVPNVLSLPGIRQLQLLLLKVVLLLGVEIHWGVTFTGLQPPPRKGKYFSAPWNLPLPHQELGQYLKKGGPGVAFFVFVLF